MADHTITVSSDFLNDFEWQLQRLALFIEMLEGLSLSLRDLHQGLSIVLGEARTVV